MSIINYNLLCEINFQTNYYNKPTSESEKSIIINSSTANFSQFIIHVFVYITRHTRAMISVNNSSSRILYNAHSKTTLYAIGLFSRALLYLCTSFNWSNNKVAAHISFRTLAHRIKNKKFPSDVSEGV